MTHDYDFAVIGGGSGGVRAARLAASYGARVALVEAGRLGGTCVNVGCVPKKLMVYGASYGDALADMRGYGWSAADVRFDWTTLCAGRDAEVARLNRVYGDLLERAGVEVIQGRARLDGPHRVVVGDRAFTAAHVLVATGGRPLRPTEQELPGASLAWVSDDVFAAPVFPKRIVVVGGGYIACELATVFHGLGAEVDLVHRGAAPLRGFDPDLRHELANALRARGVRLRLGSGIRGIERAGGGLRVAIEDGDTVEADAVLLAIGRLPSTAGLGLEEAGVALAPNGAVRVGDDFRTTVPTIFAVGDVIDRVKLTPVALAEATVVATNLFGPGDRAMDYRDVPTAVFTLPPIGTVGLGEEEARRLGPVRIFKSAFTPLRHRMTGRAERVLVKLVVDRETDRVLGVHAIGEEAPEIVQGFAVALKCGATKAQLDATIGIHPTIAEELVTLRQEWVPPEQEELQ